MRKFAILLGCAALLSTGLATAAPRYHAHFNFAKVGAGEWVFSEDRNACLRQTTTAYWVGAPYGFHYTGSDGFQYMRHANAFYQCMTTRGYRADPYGPFKISFWAEA